MSQFHRPRSTTRLAEAPRPRSAPARLAGAGLASVLALAALSALAAGCTGDKTVYVTGSSAVATTTPSPSPTPSPSLSPTPSPTPSPSPSASPQSSPTPNPDVDTDPPEGQAGARLFLETRFSQFFFANNTSGDVNTPLATGDSVVSVLSSVAVVASGVVAGPFAGTAMNCRQCHLVDDIKGTPGVVVDGVRTYCDLARRSPIPGRSGNAGTLTPRNSPPLLNATIGHSGPVFLHFDGEFATVEDLVESTYTGRNFGWLPSESATALSNLADVIRHDDGAGTLAARYGSLSYATLLTGQDPTIPARLLIPSSYRIDVSNSSDQEILDAVASLVHAYLDSITSSFDAAGQFNGSPYDVFLIKNNLPRSPLPGETGVAYSQRLLAAIDGLASVAYVTSADGSFTLHQQAFQFGATELAGLKTFFTLAPSPAPSPAPTSGVGNCVLCHTPPQFTDFNFHNIGSAQDEYDSAFGMGAFATFLQGVPSWSTRDSADLPPSSANPAGLGTYRSPLDPGNSAVADLGVWNVFGNPFLPNPQASLETLFGTPSDATLATTIARFKTASVRDPGQSAPYFHTGQKDTLEDVVQHYIDFSALARSGNVPNAAPELSGIEIAPSDLPNIVAFLNSLNEDYD